MKYSLYVGLRGLMLVTIITIDIWLLYIQNYFSSSKGENLQFGLEGVTSSERFYTYSEYSNICKSSIAEICLNLSNLSQAGKYLKVIIVVDTSLVVFYLLFTFIINCYLKRFIEKTGTSQEIARSDMIIFKFLYKATALIVLHPVLINVGTGIWIGKSKVEKFSSLITIETGFIVLIFQCFLSLLAIACYIWEISATKRKNMKNVKYLAKLNKNSEAAVNRQQSIENKSFDTFVKT